ncbi:hypothetical protein AYJ54_24650 [Bradyrhizobium centrolobii]|uniref:Uncharacterized protein n=2 Tax=Bradyrhizobium TaxID=374 RepID=A0A176YXN8_9BRAD|nr:hypothetical protein AYJ54_24650 [Bradyrhizobium centrolobii]OAF12504.1 hypothetical protein AXW67_20050 [Bradyrhizobium neotropicale]
MSKRALRVQRAQVTRYCKRDVVEQLKCLIRALAGQQGLSKSDHRVKVARLLLQRGTQSLLVNIATEGMHNALAHSRIDILGAQ